MIDRRNEALDRRAAAAPAGSMAGEGPEAGGKVSGPIEHGGDSSALRSRLGLGDSPLLDFSTSVNPLGPPPRALEAARKAIDQAGLYPEPFCPRLVERLAEWHGVPADRVMVGAGTTELISLVGQSLREVLALHAQEMGDPEMHLAHLVEPTYGEYRRTSVLNQFRTQVWHKQVLGWLQDFLPRSAAGVFWTGHPNNPTGRVWDPERLRTLIDDTLGLLTVVDEAFLPFLPDGAGRSLAALVPGRDNLLVLRSLTKIYAIPGLRIGYALASPDMIIRLRQYQNPWSVSALAIAAALAALDDPEHLERTTEFVAREAARMLDRLWEIPGLRPAWPARERPDDAPAVPNFLLVSLVETPFDSIEAQAALARRGLLVRECSNFPGLEPGAVITGPDQLIATRGHLRIGLRSPAQNDALLAALWELGKA